MNCGRTAFVLVALLASAGCRSETAGWSSVEHTDSVEELNAFIREYPSSPHLVQAKARLALVEEKLRREREDKAYSVAVAAHSVEALELFLKQYPGSDKAKQARAEASTLAYSAAVAAHSVEALERFLKQYPESDKAEQARAEAGALRLKTLVPDCVFVHGTIAFMDAEAGTWYGKLTYSLRNIMAGHGPDLVPPDPKRETVVVIFVADVPLPKGVKSGAAYLWRGGTDFVFLRTVDPQMRPEALARLVGLKTLDASEMALAPWRGAAGRND